MMMEASNPVGVHAGLVISEAHGFVNIIGKMAAGFSLRPV